MAIVTLTKDDFDSYSVLTTPTRYFRSSSLGGVTGSVYVYARHSDVEKELAPLDAFRDATHDDSDIAALVKQIQTFGRFIMKNPTYPEQWRPAFNAALETYLTKVNELGTSARKFKAMEVNRFVPGTRWSQNMSRKLTVKNTLNKYYRVLYPSAQWAFTNYNSLNFFSSSQVPNSSALIYPMRSAPAEHTGYATGSYIPSGAFSLDFYINPRYKSFEGDAGPVIVPGTIMHVPDVFAVSMITGSLRDERSRVDSWRLMLQVKHSTNINPSMAQTNVGGNYPYDMIFMSDNNVFRHNRWYHVVVRWGTDAVNNGTGSFNIDGVDRGKFVIPSGTIALELPASGWQEPAALFIGNYFEPFDGAIDNQALTFFGTDTALREGLDELDDVLNQNEPNDYQMRFPLVAEMHDVAIKRHYMDDVDIAASASVGPMAIDSGSKGIAFYLPPFFVQESSFRQYVTDRGGILQTPFFEIDGTTDDPFNVAMAFGVNGHYMNLENYVRDFASDNNPRLHQLSGTAISYTTQAREANEFLYDDPYVRKRNLTILPCDDGNFRPSYELLMSESLNTKFVNDLGYEDHSLVSLDNLLLDQSLIFGTDFDSINGDDSKSDDKVEAFVNEQIGFTPEQPGISPGAAFNTYIRAINDSIASGNYGAGVQAGAPLTIFNRTRDSSSNQVTFFDFSNLFYGDRIVPGTFTIKDPSITGSGGHVSLTLKDDGFGNLYRADCQTSASTWCNVGNIYYNEGIVVVKNPSAYFFGKEEYEMSFKGERRVHVLNVNVVVGKNEFNSSSNPNWMPVSASASTTDPDQDFVYITGINFHDDNMNVVMKAQLAQPITKRFRDKLAFKVKIDF